MIKIEIKKDTVIEKEVTVKATGELLRLYSQVGYLHTGDDYPVKCEIPLGNSKSRRAAYQPGIYTLSPSSFRIGNFGQIELNRYEMQLTMLPPVVLEALKRESAKAAA